MWAEVILKAFKDFYTIVLTFDTCVKQLLFSEVADWVKEFANAGVVMESSESEDDHEVEKKKEAETAKNSQDYARKRKFSKKKFDKRMHPMEIEY